MSKGHQATYEEAIEIAKKHHQEGNLTLASITYNDILKAIPDDFASLHALGIISYQSANFDDGIKYIKQAVSQREDYAESWNVYGVLLGQLGKHKDALKKWQKALELKPDYPEAFINMSNTYWKLKDYKKAQSHAEKAIELRPDYPDGYVNLGNALAGQGHHEEAIKIWEKAIAIHPKHPNAHINIGNALRDLGRIKESEAFCEKAIKIAPDDPNANVNLGNAYRDLGKYEEAEAMYRKAINLKPDFVDAHNNLATVLIDMFRYDEAAAAVRFALAFDPNQPQAYTNLAVCLSETGQLRLAEEAARKALTLKPDSLEARIDLADILLLCDRLQEAETIFSEAMKMVPESPRLYIKLGTVLERLNRVDEALKCTLEAVKLSPETPEFYHRLAMVYYMAGKTDKALETIDKAIDLKSDFIQAFALKSDILQSQGKMEEALEVAKVGLNLNRELPFVYLALSGVKKFTADDPDFIDMKKAAENVRSFGRAHTTGLQFALSRAHENIGDYDKAFEYLKAGNDLKRSSIIYDSYMQHGALRSIPQSYNEKFMKNLEGLGFEDDTPIFIVGMPRSGTTLTEQIISSHPKVFGAGELTYLQNVEKDIGPLSKDTCKRTGERYVELIRAINKESKKAEKITDKMPGNYSRIGQIVSILPNAKIIHCRRNPIDTCLSCYKQLFSNGQYWSYNLEDLAEHYAIYEETMDYWRKALPGKFMEIYYEDTVNDFENQARKLIDYVGLEWDDACLSPHKHERAVLTASRAQVRKPVYKSSVEGWRRYEKQLQPLVEPLEKFVRKQ